MSKTETPSIRFRNFDDAWEQRKLGDIGKARSGVGFPDAEQGGVTGIPFFKVSDMNLGGNENEMAVANNYVTAEQIAVHRWSPITELPAIFFAKVGAAVMLNRKRLCRFPFLLDNNTMAYSLSSTKWDADFAKALFGTVDLTSLVQVGALPSYNAGDVESMEIYLPSLLEQGQIGGFFKQLDRLITLHQRKFEKLTNVKKSMLEKMFPKYGADVPEVRFKGFTGAWKRKRFSELYESVIQKNDLTYGVDKNITVASMQYRPDIKVTDIEYLRTYNVLKLGDIAFEGHQSKEFRYGRFAENDIGDGIVSHIFAVFRPKTDYDLMFWKYAINNERIMRPVLVRCTKASTMMNDLVSKDFLEENILVPDIEEQKKIGTVLSEIDRLISLQQEELKKLQSFKKALLEKMFV